MRASPSNNEVIATQKIVSSLSKTNSEQNINNKKRSGAMWTPQQITNKNNGSFKSRNIFENQEKMGF